MRDGRFFYDLISSQRTLTVEKGMNIITMDEAQSIDIVAITFRQLQLGSLSIMTTMCISEKEFPQLEVRGFEEYTSVLVPISAHSSLG